MIRLTRFECAALGFAAGAACMLLVLLVGMMT